MHGRGRDSNAPSGAEADGEEDLFMGPSETLQGLHKWLRYGVGEQSFSNFSSKIRARETPKAHWLLF